jgi:hypothetical protein
VKLTDHIHLVPRFKLTGATPLFPLYAFIACIEIALRIQVCKAVKVIPVKKRLFVKRFIIPRVLSKLANLKVLNFVATLSLHFMDYIVLLNRQGK